MPVPLNPDAGRPQCPLAWFATRGVAMTDVVLIQGLWLKPEVWAEVQNELERLGLRAAGVDLPVGADATLVDQTDAVLAAVDAADGPPLVVGHSAAATLAWLAADAREVAGVVLIGGFPGADGEAYAGFLPAGTGSVDFLGWSDFEEDAADLNAASRAAMQAEMVTMPRGVADGVVRLSNPARYNVPMTLICPEFSPDDAKAWIDGGDLPELAKATKLTLVNLDSGHWPMVSQPAALAQLIADAAG